MKNFRRLCFALLLMAAFSLPVFADGGATQGPYAPAPGDTQGPSDPSTDPGDGHSPGLAEPGDGHTPGFAEDLASILIAMGLV